MKNINFSLDFQSLGAKFRSNSTLIFYLVFILILLFELWVLYPAGRQILASQGAPQGIVPSKGVRLDFEEYEQSINRIENGKDYSPEPPIFQNPFVQ